MERLRGEKEQQLHKPNMHKHFSVIFPAGYWSKVWRGGWEELDQNQSVGVEQTNHNPPNTLGGCDLRRPGTPERPASSSLHFPSTHHLARRQQCRWPTEPTLWVWAQLVQSELVKKTKKQRQCEASGAGAAQWALINASASQYELAEATKKQTVRNLMKFSGKERERLSQYLPRLLVRGHAGCRRHR